MSGSIYANPGCPSQADYLVFIRTEMAIAPIYLPDDSVWISASYNMAKNNVYCWLLVNPPMYTRAVYNYAADRLMRIAVDMQGQDYFADHRKALGIHGFSAGVIQSSSDSGSSQSMAVPEWSKLMTITDIEMSRTFYGRTYLGLAQESGNTIWGLT